jgi:hypothetical protein
MEKVGKHWAKTSVETCGPQVTTGPRPLVTPLGKLLICYYKVIYFLCFEGFGKKIIIYISSAA